MRNLGSFSWSLRVIAVKAVAFTVLSPYATGQSFDYPANSPSLFSAKPQAAAGHAALEKDVPTAMPRNLAPQQERRQTADRSSRPTLFSKLVNLKPLKHAPPVFSGANSDSAIPAVIRERVNRGAQRSVFLDPYAVQASGWKNPNGYLQPNVKKGAEVSSGNLDNQAQVENVAFDHSSQPDQISVLNNTGDSEFYMPARPQKKLSDRVAQIPHRSSPDRLGSAPQSHLKSQLPSFEPSQTTPSKPQRNRQAGFRRQDSNVRTAQRPRPIKAPVAAPVQRVSMPRNDFQQEFEKAYQFINQPKATQHANSPRVAQTESAMGELMIDDFSDSPRRSIEGDLSLEGQVTIEAPQFVDPKAFEQSPNATPDELLLPSQPNDVDGLSETRIPQPSTNPPWLAEENADRRDREQNNPSDRGALDLESPDRDGVASDADGLDSEFGDFDDWDPPETKATTKTDRQSLKDDFAELSKPFNSTSPTGNRLDESVTVNESPVWWKQLVNQPLHPENKTLPIDSNGLVFAALKNSPRIQAVSKSPLIRELQVVEADAEFDPVRFVQTQFQDRVDPVGNSLTIGQGSTVQFLRDNIWTGEAGIRRKLRTGADLTVSQQLGFQNSNSNNFTPQDQGTATLALNVTQPLLRGRGRYFNQAQILIAQSTGGVAWELFQQDLQEELEGVVDAYWQLYMDRSIYLQRKRNVDRGQLILDRLEGRRELDSLPAQIARAKSSVQTRKTELANAFRNIRNAETEIRRRIADRNWMAAQTLELIPAELATIEDMGWELDQVVKTALNNRPEIRESMRRIKIAGVQRDISENELLPELSFLVGTYVSALQGESDVLGAFADQFGEVTPGYSFGLQYELPRFNRAARSRFQQRHLQFRRLQNELEEVIQNVIAESQVAVRRISSAIETLGAAEEAIVAARVDLSQNERRWESFALVEGDIAEGVTPTTILDQLLDSQERLSQSEIIYAQAERELKIAEVALQRSMGTLLMQQQVSYDRAVKGDTPVIKLHKHRNPGPAPFDDEPLTDHRAMPSQQLLNQQALPQQVTPQQNPSLPQSSSQEFQHPANASPARLHRQSYQNSQFQKTEFQKQGFPPFENQRRRTPPSSFSQPNFWPQ